MIDAPNESLYRMLAPVGEIRVAQDGRSFEGYAAVWNAPTVINSWEGNFIESFKPGAFRNTLEARGDKVKFLWDHGFDPSIGQKPIGTLTSLTEDDKGLRVQAKMLNRPYADDIAEALRAKAVDGMSFKFSVVREEWDESKDIPVRTINEAKLYEVSVVTFPAYEATTAGVRGADAYRAWLATRPSTTDAADTGTSVDTDAADPGTSVDSARLERLEFLYEVRHTLQTLRR